MNRRHPIVDLLSNLQFINKLHTYFDKVEGFPSRCMEANEFGWHKGLGGQRVKVDY